VSGDKTSAGNSPPPSRKRVSGPVVPHQLKWHGRLAARLITLAVGSLALTWRLKVTDEGGRVRDGQNSPLIFAFWHNRLALAVAGWKWVRQHRPAQGIAALISASKDGALLARVYEHAGIRPVRGSSSRRGPQALLELSTALRNGCHAAITPDGPRGPKCVAQEGIIALASATGLPIIPGGASISSKWQLRSWDSFQIPLPFARCEIRFGAPINVPRGATDAQREQARSELEAALRQLNPD